MIYYIDKNELSSSKIVLAMIDELLRPKYNNITFYCHNLGGFDVVFIFKILYNYNEEQIHDKDKYKISSILRDDKIIKLTIRKGSKN